MNRLDLAPENSLATLLKYLEDAIEQFKQKQRHSGASGMLGYFVDSGLTWDETETLPDTGDPFFFESAGFEIIFTASGKQPFPIADIYMDLFFNGTDEENRPIELPNGFYGYEDGVATVTMFQLDPEYDVSYSDNETQYRWTFDFSWSRYVTYYMKVYVAGSSDGTVEVNRIY